MFYQHSPLKIDQIEKAKEINKIDRKKKTIILKKNDLKSWEKNVLRIYFSKKRMFKM